MMNRSYSAKLFLFGEYTILQDGNGLAIPLRTYFGQWNTTTYPNESSRELNQMLPFFKKKDINGFDINQFKIDVKNGLFFDSNIPQGYGVGSSAALSAAIFDRYVDPKKDILTDTKQVLADIESYFHGKSSGIDPLVSYCNKAIMMNQNSIIELKKSQLESNFFLIDTHQRRETKNLVDYYINEYNVNEAFQKNMDYLSTLNYRAIQLYIEESDQLFDVIKEISIVQFGYLKHMIPTDFIEKWRVSLESDDHCIKLNGAGGGGFLLGYER